MINPTMTTTHRNGRLTRRETVLRMYTRFLTHSGTQYTTMAEAYLTRRLRMTQNQVRSLMIWMAENTIVRVNRIGKTYRFGT